MKWPVRSCSRGLAIILLLGGLLSGLTIQALSQPPEEPQTKPTILEFHRKFCPVCKQSEQNVRALQTMFPGQFEVRRLYIDEQEHMFRRYRVAIVPTQVFLDAAGREVFRHEGLFIPKKHLEKLRELKFIRE